MSLDWQRHGGDTWIAGGVGPVECYVLKRASTKLWRAVVHEADRSNRIGLGTFNEMKRLCRQHADITEQALSC